MIDKIRRESGAMFAGAFMSAGLLGISIVPALYYHPKETDPSRLEPVKPIMNTEFGRADYTPNRLAAAIPVIRMAACIFSEKAVRHKVSPSQVSLPSCGSSDFQVTIADNLIDVTVSGLAIVEKVEHPFTVVLQHNPPSVTEDGLIVTAIRVD